VEEFTAPTTRRKLDPRLLNADRFDRFLGGLVVPQVGNLDEHELLVPEVVLPGQLEAAPVSPEAEEWKRLCSAVLLDAIRSINRTPSRRLPGQRDEVLRWFRDADAPVVMNLNDCCSALGLDVGRVQREALRLADEPQKTTQQVKRATSAISPSNS
ncbi:MAG TPA: hypothetical protein VKB84_20290, partial [Candidatus Binataceae bacterium]|nr:hypothetical protein [Candidatus Binataceae bacterium]